MSSVVIPRDIVTALASSGIICAILTWGLAGLLIGAGIMKMLKVPFKGPVGLVLIGIFLGIALRMAWWINEFLQSYYVANGLAQNPQVNLFSYERYVVSYVISHLSWLLVSWALFAAIWGWVDAIHIKYPVPSLGFLKAIKYIMVGLGFLHFVFMVAVFVVSWTYCRGGVNVPVDRRPICQTLQDSLIIFFALATAMSAMGLFMYAGIVLYLLKHNDTPRDSEGGTNKQWVGVFTKATLVMLVCTIFYALRCFAFMYGPITQRNLPVWVGYTFGYILPETLPCIALMFMAITTSRSNRKFIAEQMGQAGSNYVMLDEMPDDMVDDED